MKKKIIIIVLSIFSFFIVCLGGLFIFYKSSLKATGNKNDVVLLVIPEGTTSKQIVNLIYENGLLKNKYAGYVYIKLNSGYVLQAGKYELNKGMDFKTVLDHISAGRVIDDSISVTFYEGKTLKQYAGYISKTFGYSEENIIKTLNDKEYLKELVDKYWFLTDSILNDKLYYGLEGYLFPDTYSFNKDASIKDIVNKMLSTTGKKLEKYKDKIELSKFSVHELLTLASIVEGEAGNASDRKGVASVFYNRLNSGWSLGSDVTTYYGLKLGMWERDLTIQEINTANNYNTRHISMAGKLPVGPVCNPGMESIIAVLEPKEAEYYYFVADKNGKTYFTKTEEEHRAIISKLKADGLWYEYK